jgi:hypothetical protein
MSKRCLALLLSCAWTAPAGAWEPARNADGELGEYIAFHKVAGDSIFVSECQFEDSAKAVVVFPIDSGVGRFFFIQDQIRPDHAYAVYTGEVEVLGSSFRVRIDIDVDPMDSFRQLATNLMSFPFHLRTPDKLDLIFSEQALLRC